MAKNPIIRAWAVPSMSSYSGEVYELRLYGDGTTSCSCKAWRYPRTPGTRTCKHVKALAAQLAEGRVSYRPVTPQAPDPLMEAEAYEAQQAPRPQVLSPEASRLLRRGMFPEPEPVRPVIEDRGLGWNPWRDPMRPAEAEAREAAYRSIHGAAEPEPAPESPKEQEPPWESLSPTAKRARLLDFRD